MPAPHQYIPYFKFRTVKTGSFSSVGNQVTVTDGDVRENSIILIQHTSAHNGNWYVTVNASGGGSFVVTSDVVEDGTPTFNYEIF